MGSSIFAIPPNANEACEDEVRLNRRLTTDVYLGVVPVTTNGVDAPGEPLEWAVVMRRLPAERMLDRLLQEGKAPDDLAERLADRLIPFHQPSSRAKPSDLLAAARGDRSEGPEAATPTRRRDSSLRSE